MKIVLALAPRYFPRGFRIQGVRKYNAEELYMKNKDRSLSLETRFPLIVRGENALCSL